MGILYVVATPIGNLGDFSKRAVETLENSDLILAEDTRCTIKLLNYFNIKKKMISYHKFNEIKKSDEILELLKNGKNISLVSDAGTPCISDPGYILIKKARENNIEVIGIPGCSAIIDALSICGLDTSSFTFYGFVPTDNKSKNELFEEIKYSNVKVKVLYESPKRIIKLLDDIKKYFPSSLVCVCTELTKIYEKSIYGTIDEVYDKMNSKKDNIKGEYVVLISNEVKSKNNINDISIEAKLFDILIKDKCTIKEAISILNDKNKDLSKKDIYNASLNLKELLK